MADKNLSCGDCGMEFIFNEREQAFYSEKGFTEPRRCPSCRQSRKAARGAESGGGYSGGSYPAGGSDFGSYSGAGYSAGGYGGGASGSGGDYGGGNRSGGDYGGGNRSGGDFSRGPREMFEATCSSCGKEARVPFRPTNGKPVYCSDCFRTQRG